jgi:prolyl-tRNA synthetase
MDNRDIRAGKKFYDWEMRGVPLRIELGPRDLNDNNVVFLRRDTMEKITVSLEEDIIDNVNDLMSDISVNMREKARQKFNTNIHQVDNIEDVKESIETEKGIISFAWCGEESCGKEIEEIANVDILGVQEEETSGKCFNCSKDAKFKAFLAKTY